MTTRSLTLSLTLVLLTAAPLAASGWIPFTNAKRIGSGAYAQEPPVIASNGFEYLVAWQMSMPTGSAIFTRRVNTDGTVEGELPRPLDPEPTYFARALENPRGVSLSAGRDGYFLSWISDAGLNVAVTDSYGAVERRTTLPAERLPARPYGKTITAWNGNVHLVVYGFNGPFWGTLFDDNGAVVGLPGTVLGNDHGEYTFNAVVADSHGFLLLSSKPTWPGTEVYGRRITPNGIAGEWFLVRSIASTMHGMSAVYDGNQLSLVWSDDFGVWFAKLDPSTGVALQSRQLTPGSGLLGGATHFSGRLLINYTVGSRSHVIAVASDGSSTPIETIEAPHRVAIATNGTTVLSARNDDDPWPRFYGDHQHVVGRFIVGGPSKDDVRISGGLGVHEHGAIAELDGKVLAVWDERVSTERHIRAAFVARDAASTDRDIQVSSSATHHFEPAVAAGARSFLVVWSASGEGGSRKVLARRISSDGTLLDAEDLVLTTRATRAPQVTSNGTDWLVVWTRESTYHCGFAPCERLVAARVSASGILLDAEAVEISTSNSFVSRPDVTWDGTDYILAWGEHVGYRTFCSWIRAARLAPDLSSIDRTSASSVQPTCLGGAASPRIGTIDGRVVIAWQGGTDGAPQVRYRLMPRDWVGEPARRRAVGGEANAIRTFPGVLRGVVRDDRGGVSILFEAVAPPPDANRSFFLTHIDATGTAGAPVRLAGIDPDERPLGRPLRRGQKIWIPVLRYVPTAASDRLFVRELD